MVRMNSWNEDFLLFEAELKFSELSRSEHLGWNLLGYHKIAIIVDFNEYKEMGSISGAATFFGRVSKLIKMRVWVRDIFVLK